MLEWLARYWLEVLFSGFVPFLKDKQEEKFLLNNIGSSGRLSDLSSSFEDGFPGAPSSSREVFFQWCNVTPPFIWKISIYKYKLI